MTKKKKNARERRALVGALCTAAVIVAGSTFAWFTSSDEVTNRLSASADYDVKIVESFAPPENWIPGQQVDKDVYAVNTGNIPAYAKATVSGAMSITREVPVPLTTIVATSSSTTTYSYTANVWDGVDMSTSNFTAQTLQSSSAVTFSTPTGLDIEGTDYPSGTKFYCDINGARYYISDASAPEPSTNSSTATTAIKGTDDLVTLDEDERYAVEAGAYLAYKPVEDSVNKVGEQVVAYKEGATPGENFTNGTDFTPHADGLYIFRRSVVVKNGNGLDAGTEDFTYDGYYFFGGVYYKIMNLNAVPDNVTDLAGDGINTDGNLGNGTTASLVKESKEYYKSIPLTYDGASNRLVATLENTAGSTTDLTTKAAAVDAAEHELAAAEVALREAMANAGVRDVNVDNAQSAYDAAVAAYNNAKETYDRAKEAYNNAKAAYDTAKAAFGAAQTAVNGDLSTADTGIVGNDTGSVALTSVTAAPNPIDNTKSTYDSSTLTLKDKNGNTIATIAGAAAGTSIADAYADALTAYNTFLNTYGVTDNDNVNHIYNPYFAELANVYSTKLTSMPTDTIENKVKYVLDTLTYTELTASSLNYTTGDLHNFHTLVVNLKLAKDNLDTALQDYYSDLGTLNNAIGTLGEGTSFKKIENNGAVTATNINNLNPENNSAMFTTLKTTRENLDGTTGNTYADVTTSTVGTSGAKGTMDAAKAAMDGALTDLNDARKYITGEVTGTATVDDNLAAAQAKYNQALANLNAARANYNVADSNYASSGDIVIYINLNNVALSGDTGKKWQILPAVVADKQAVFYYTSILRAGDVSEQLVDSVELADSVTQDMYKYFDFDLNVKLDSAQITYADNEKSAITANAANEGFDWTESNGTPTHNVTGTISPANANDVATAVVAWTETITTP